MIQHVEWGVISPARAFSRLWRSAPSSFSSWYPELCSPVAFARHCSGRVSPSPIRHHSNDAKFDHPCQACTSSLGSDATEQRINGSERENKGWSKNLRRWTTIPDWSLRWSVNELSKRKKSMELIRLSSMCIRVDWQVKRLHQWSDLTRSSRWHFEEGMSPFDRDLLPSCVDKRSKRMIPRLLWTRAFSLHWSTPNRKRHSTGWYLWHVE